MDAIQSSVSSDNHITFAQLGFLVSVTHGGLNPHPRIVDLIMY
jgi:hypothetical protein